MDLKQKATSPGALLRSMGLGAIDQAQKSGLSVSQFLEAESPTERGGPNAFQRALIDLGIRTAGDLESGAPASSVRDILGARNLGSQETEDTNARAVAFVELICRRYRRSIGVNPDMPDMTPEQFSNYRAIFTREDYAIGTWANPWQSGGVTRQLSGPSIPLDQIVAFTFPVTTGGFRSFYISHTANARGGRVAEGADLPEIKITGAERSMKLGKFGGIVKVTDEARDMPLDWFMLAVDMAAEQSQIDQVDLAVDTAVNGDGNAGTSATNFNLTALDAGATPPNPTALAFRLWRKKLRGRYVMVAVIAKDLEATRLELLQFGSANYPMVLTNGASGNGGFALMNPAVSNTLQLGISDTIATSLYLGMDTRRALIRLVNVNVATNEVARWIQNQTTGLSIVESSAIMVNDAAASKTMNAAA